MLNFKLCSQRQWQDDLKLDASVYTMQAQAQVDTAIVTLPKSLNRLSLLAAACSLLSGPHWLQNLHVVTGGAAGPGKQENCDAPYALGAIVYTACCAMAASCGVLPVSLLVYIKFANH